MSYRMGSSFHYRRSFGLYISKKTTAYAHQHTNLNAIEERNCGSLNNSLLVGSMPRCYLSLRKCSSLVASAKAPFSCVDQSKEADEVSSATSSSQGMECNRVDHVVWVLHGSARSFSQAVESLGLAGSHPGLAMAWLGKDVNEWHRRIAYQVAVYALMETATDLEILLSHERQNEVSPVKEILTPLKTSMGEFIECQLKMRHPYLVQWFRGTEMPRMAGYFITLLKKWSIEYAGSGIAGIIVAITCCSAVVKLGSRRISCPSLTLSLEDILVKLMDFSLNLASVDKLHQLATEAGFELNFLFHFGRKILPSEKIEDLEFWIGLAHKRLSEAFQEESIILSKQNFQCKIQSDSLATLGLFAYLGRRTRIFLSAMGIKDLDEMVKDFLSYLECGSLFIYPEFSSIPVYQLFMEVVTDEIGWLDFYASYVPINCREKRARYNACQAEKEIILSSVFTVCYDVFSGFAHFNRSSQQSPDTALLSYLLHSAFLNIEDDAAFDNHTSSKGSITRSKFSLVFETRRKSHDLTTERCEKSNPQDSFILKKAPISACTNKATCEQGTSTDKLNPLRESFIKRYSIKLASISADLWMGTQLLFIDIMIALELLARQAHGCKSSTRQRKRLGRTLMDIIVLIPVTVLMLLPVTAVGHAAMLAAINKYIPCMIPSPYSSQRLDVVMQLKQTREMGDQSGGNLEDLSPTIS